MPSRKEATPESAPSTVRRSGRKAQDTWGKTHDRAVQEYGEGERAHRTAFGALKHTHEKVGDHWEPKEKGRKGPSDPQSARPRNTGGRSSHGVDESAGKAHLYGIAQRLRIPGRSTMTKAELVRAIDKANRSSTRHSRES